jgi:DNA-binding transcriptional ArsR family regulator
VWWAWKVDEDGLPIRLADRAGDQHSVAYCVGSDMIRFRLSSSRPADCIAFEYSPLVECLMSLHVLVRPRQHALRHGWVREMRSLDRRLRRRIDSFAFVFAQPVPDLFLLHAGEDARTLGDQLAGIDRLPAQALRDGFGLRCDGPFRGTREQAMAWAAANEPGSVEAIALLDDDPREFARQFVELVEAYWRSAFAEEWRRVEPLLWESVDEDRRLLASSGVWPLLARLPGRCRIAPEEAELRFVCEVESALELRPDSALVLSPSTFIWPHAAANADPRWPSWITYPAVSAVRAAVPDRPPAELLDVLRALGDETRLRVLKAIAASPRTTQELAPIVGLTTTGLSKSLLRLADAGLVEGRREGKFVVYSLTPDCVVASSPAVRTFLFADGSLPDLSAGSSHDAA